jgi:surfeit locus 1 family protein
MTFVMFLILLGLGTWQVRRLAWKENILAEIARAEAAPAVPLGPHPPPFAKVSATGRFREDLAAFYGVEVRNTQAGPEMGAELIVPLEGPGAEPVLVDRGWVPTEGSAPIDWPQAPVTVDGYAHAPDRPGLFTPAADPTRRRFYALDPAAIGAALGLKRVAPFTLVALGPEVPGQYPVPAQHLPRPPNNHLLYALTWYALAGALVVVFWEWSRKVLRDDSL